MESTFSTNEATGANISPSARQENDAGFAAAFGAGETCEEEVVDQLVDLQRHALEYARQDGLIAEDERSAQGVT
jgi:hypothetical protein